MFVPDLTFNSPVEVRVNAHHKCCVPLSSFHCFQFFLYRIDATQLLLTGWSPLESGNLLGDHETDDPGGSLVSTAPMMNNPFPPLATPSFIVHSFSCATYDFVNSHHNLVIRFLL
jgi:hypothetical protein